MHCRKSQAEYFVKGKIILDGEPNVWQVSPKRDTRAKRPFPVNNAGFRTSIADG